MLQSAALQRVRHLRGRFVEDVVLPNRKDLALSQKHPAVDDHAVHVSRVGEMCEARHGHVRRIEVRLAQVDQHDAGLLARLQRAEVAVEAEGTQQRHGGGDASLQAFEQREPRSVP